MMEVQLNRLHSCAQGLRHVSGSLTDCAEELRRECGDCPESAFAEALGRPLRSLEEQARDVLRLARLLEQVQAYYAEAERRAADCAGAPAAVWQQADAPARHSLELGGTMDGSAIR